MNKQYIAVLDSGIGGLAVLEELQRNVHGENFLYFGDNQNAPYGNKNKREILSLTVNNLLEMDMQKIKAIVFACNTLSVTIREEVQNIFGVPVFGVFPPCESSILAGRNTLVLSTVRTASMLNCRNSSLKIVGLPYLAGEIEKYYPNIDEINLNKHFEPLFGEHFDDIILGCTHYNLIKKRIFDYFCPQNIMSGIDNLIIQIKRWQKREEKCKNVSKSQVFFCGNCADYNRKIFEKVVNSVVF